MGCTRDCTYAALLGEEGEEEEEGDHAGAAGRYAASADGEKRPMGGAMIGGRGSGVRGATLW